LAQAIIAIEDRRFYQHWGVDLRGILRAGWRNSQAGATREGASTITQQLARLVFLSPERTFRRKLQEALLAIWLEGQLTKEEILLRYLNTRSEEHTSELQSRGHLVCRLLLEKKKRNTQKRTRIRIV